MKELKDSNADPYEILKHKKALEDVTYERLKAKKKFKKTLQ